jgi:integrase
MADLFEKYLAEKMACGFSERTSLRLLNQLDRLWRHYPDETPGMTQEWYKIFMTAKRKPISGATLSNRATNWRQLALFFRRQGKSAYVPDRYSQPVHPGSYLPFIYTKSQLSALFAVADAILERRQYRNWYRHWSPGLLFRMMYGTGMRSGEALALCRRDFNPRTGLLSVYGQKNHQMRHLPLSSSLAARLGGYLRQNPGTPDQPLFASALTGRAMNSRVVSRLFRLLLPRAGLPPRRNGRGPRMHDLRHTFAVHNMERWIRAGENLEAKIPVLAAYMGHNRYQSTYYYLRLVEPMFPDLLKRFGVYAAGVIPEGGDA